MRLRLAAVVQFGVVASIAVSVLAAGSLLVAHQAAATLRAERVRQLQERTSVAADHVAAYLGERLSSLEVLAETPFLDDGRMDTDQILLDSLPGVSTFSSVAILDGTGVARARSGGLPAGGVVSYADRDHVQDVMRSRKPSIGSPVTGRINSNDVLLPMAVPLDTRENPGGILVSGLRLGVEGGFNIADDVVVIGRNDKVVYDGRKRIPALSDAGAWPAVAKARHGGAGVLAGASPVDGVPSQIAFRTINYGIVVLGDVTSSELVGDIDRRLALENRLFALFLVASLTMIAFFTRRSLLASAREREAASRADSALRDRDMFIASVTHDLRAPLTVIRAATELADRKDSALLKELHGEVIDAAMRAERLILDLEEARTGVTSFAPVPTDLVNLLESCLAGQRQLDPDRRYVLHADSPALTGLWDPVLLHRLFENLLSNARKYSASGTTVSVSIRTEEEMAVVEVRDEGIGIPAADLEKVRGAFVRGSNVNGRPGTGVGLANVESIAARHGGDVALTSQEGEGTTVRVRIPIPQPSQIVMAASDRSRERGSA